MDPDPADPHQLGLDLDVGALLDLAAMLGFGLFVRGPDGRVVAMSRTMREMSGYSLEDLASVGDPTLVFAEESRAAARRWIDQRERGDAVAPTFRGRVTRRSGEVVTVEMARASCTIDGAPHTLVAMQRIDAIVDLEQRQQLLGDALDRNPLPVIIYHYSPGDRDRGVDERVEVIASNTAADELVGGRFEPGFNVAPLIGTSDDDPIGLLRRAAHHLTTHRTYVEERARTDGPFGQIPPARCTITRTGPATYCIFIEDISSEHASEEERRRLLERLLMAEDDERRRIADGLHDDIIQRLAAAALFIESAQQQADAAIAGRLSEAGQTVRSSIGGLRRLIFELAPPELERDGLEAALRLVAEHLFTGTDVEVTVTCSGPVATANPKVLSICYRIAAEGITNARKHARARRVAVEIAYDGARVEGSVVDDGKGIGGGSEQSGHLGLRTMRERAEMLGGWFRVGPGPAGTGTAITWSLPALPAPIARAERPATNMYRDWRPPGTVRESLPQDISFEPLIEGTPDIVSCFDRSLRHLYVNPAVETATGIPRADFIGRTNRDLGMPDDLADLWDAALLGVFASAQPAEQVFTYPSPNGERRLHARIVPEIEGGRVVSVWGVVRDITDVDGA